MKSLILYIHGQNGSAAEADHYKPLFPGSTVIGLDYTAATPWEACTEFPQKFDALRRDFEHVSIIANSIGAYFAMHALSQCRIDRAWFISPIVDMEKLIRQMMHWSHVTETDLQAQGEIATDFGETLSWDYLTYVRTHPIRWTIPTHILYGTDDTMTDLPTMQAFATRHGFPLTIMPDGEHWFHTPEQLAFLDAWIASEGGSPT